MTEKIIVRLEDFNPYDPSTFWMIPFLIKQSESSQRKLKSQEKKPKPTKGILKPSK